MRATIEALEEKLEEKDEIIDGLSQSLQAPQPVATDERTGEVLMAKIPQMEAALETQGALLESKSIALEKAKIQYDREREKTIQMEAKISELEHKLAVVESAQAQNIWGGGTGEEESAEESIETAADAIAELTAGKDREIEDLAAERDQLRVQVVQLQGNIDEMRSGWEEMENRLRFQEADVAAVATLQEKITGLERERQHLERAEHALREQLEATERQRASDTAAMNELRDRLATAQRQAEVLAQREQEWQQSRETESAQNDENAAELESLREKIENYEHELAERQEAESSLRTEIDRLQKRIEADEEESSHTREVDPSMLTRLARVEAELAEKREELRRREIELSEQYTLRIQDLERTVESMKLERTAVPELQRALDLHQQALAAHLTEETTGSMFAATLPLPAPGDDEPRIQLEAEDDTLRLRLDQLRTDLLLKEDQRIEKEEERLVAIQRKLEQIEGEVLEVDRSVRDSQNSGGVELTEILLRLESLLKEQEKNLMSAMPQMAAQMTMPLHAPMAMPMMGMPMQMPMSEREWMAPPPRPQGPSMESFQRMLSERELLIATLKRQIQDLSTKVDPEMTGDDNLLLIHGVGPYTKKILKEEFGITTFRQVTMLTPDQIDRISERLYFRGRIQREDWIGQARSLHEKKYNEAA